MGSNNMLPRIIPNPYDNTLVIQSTPEQWAQIEKLLEQLDIAPRQVLIDARIYEVDLSGDLQYGVEAFLQRVPGQRDSREQARDYLMHQRFRRDVYTRDALPLDDV